MATTEETNTNQNTQGSTQTQDSAMSGKISYIKISKIDDNGVDLTSTLSSLTQITIPYTNGSSSVCSVMGITDSGDYFTYVINNVENSSPLVADAATLNYDFTGSLGGGDTEIDLGVGGVAVPFPITTGTGSSVSFLYNSFEDKIELGTYPGKPIHIKTSPFYVNTSAEVFVELFKADSVLSPGSITRLTTTEAIQTGGNKGPFTREYSISSSVYPGDTFFLGATANTLPSGGGPFVKVGTGGGAKLTSLNIFITSSVESGPTLETIPEPYFTTKFNGNDCDVTFGNIDQYPPNPFLQDIDYSTNPIVPINMENIISGTADKGTVPESYYTSLAHITSRYLGSKNQSSGINQYVIDAGNTDFGDPINIGTYGNVSPITQEEVNIFEYEWGSTTHPMIQGYGQLKLSNILQASSKDLIRIVQKTSNAVKKPYPDGRLISTSDEVIISYRSSTNPLDPTFITGSTNTGKYYWILNQSRGEFYQVLNNTNPINATIQLGNYSQNTISEPIMPNTSKVVSTGWGIPEKPNYMLTSSFTGGVTTGDGQGVLGSQKISGSYGYIDSYQNYLLVMGWNVKIGETTLNEVDNVRIDKSINLTTKKVLNEINSGMTKGNRWYLTLYRELNNPSVSQSLEEALNGGNYLEPYNEGYDTLNSEGNFDYPLEAKGVYEIVGTYASFGAPAGSYDTPLVFMILKNGVNFPMSGSSGQRYQQLNIGQSSSTQRRQHPGSPVNNLGAFIWQATGKEQITGEEYIVIQDELKGVGPGYFINEFAPGYITDNIENITKEFGSNKT